MMWLFWIGLLIIMAIVFRWLWKLAAKIEQEELEEKQWLEYIAWMQQYDPYQAMQWQELFKKKADIKKLREDMRKTKRRLREFQEMNAELDKAFKEMEEIFSNDAEEMYSLFSEKKKKRK